MTDDQTARAMRAYDRLRDVAWRLVSGVLDDEDACCAAIESAFRERASAGGPWDSDATILLDVHREACLRAAHYATAG